MKKYLLIILIAAFSISRANACSCQNDYPFCNTLTQLPSDLVVTGVIMAKTDTINLILQIVEVFKGVETRPAITVWAGTGESCPPGWTSLATHHLGAVGDTIIIILERITTTNIENSWDVVDDYRRLKAFCYHPRLQVINGQVNGRIFGSWSPGMPLWSITTMSYADFAASWSFGNLDCEIAGRAENSATMARPHVYPNPAAQTLSVVFPDELRLTAATMQVHDMLGRLVLSEELIQSHNQVSVANLPAGMYTVSVAGRQGQLWREQLAVQR